MTRRDTPTRTNWSAVRPPDGLWANQFHQGDELVRRTTVRRRVGEPVRDGGAP